MKTNNNKDCRDLLEQHYSFIDIFLNIIQINFVFKKRERKKEVVIVASLAQQRKKQKKIKNNRKDKNRDTDSGGVFRDERRRKLTIEMVDQGFYVIFYIKDNSTTYSFKSNQQR